MSHTTASSLKITDKGLSRDGADLTYRCCGAGPLVVLIPSLGRGSEDFDALLPRLVDANLRIILPEPRGIGMCSPLNDTDTLHDMAADIGAIIAAEGYKRAVLAGHAAGNWVARVLAHDRPDLTRGVALLAAVVTNKVPVHISASISSSFDPALREADRLAHLQRVYFAPAADASVWLEGWWPKVAAAQRRAAQTTPDTEWVRVADRHQTLYVAAAKDVISPPPELDVLQSTIGPKTQLVEIPNAGHALLPEQPDAVADALINWISRLPE